MAEESVSNFSSLFTFPSGCHIREILKASNLFSSCILEEINLNLVVKVSEVEVLYALCSIQKDKSHGPD